MASATSSASVPPAPPPGPRPSDAELTKLTKANNTFAFALWPAIAQKPENFAFSPFSIESALTMTWLGAKGDTAAQMKKALAFDGPASEAADIGGRYARSLGGLVTVRVANRIFGDQSTHFEKAFLDATEKYFGAPLEPVDFANSPDPSRVHINDWVAAQTNDRIKDLIPQGAVTSDTKMALVNAIYFLGDWDRPFKKEATSPAPFHTTTAAAHDVPMMHAHEQVAFAEDDAVSVIDVPYDGEKFAMTFVLPKKVDGLAAVESKLSNEAFDGWIHAYRGTMVNITLPKFTIDTPSPLSLGDALQSVGIKNAFDKGKSEFEGMAAAPSPDARLFIGKVFHKAFVKVDEKGTEGCGRDRRSSWRARAPRHLVRSSEGVRRGSPVSLFPARRECEHDLVRGTRRRPGPLTEWRRAALVFVATRKYRKGSAHPIGSTRAWPSRPWKKPSHEACSPWVAIYRRRGSFSHTRAAFFLGTTKTSRFSGTAPTRATCSKRTRSTCREVSKNNCGAGAIRFGSTLRSTRWSRRAAKSLDPGNSERGLPPR